MPSVFSHRFHHLNPNMENGMDNETIPDAVTATGAASSKGTTHPSAIDTAKAAAKKPAAADAAKKSKSGVATKQKKDSKPKKINMVRDSYTMPENDYAKLSELKKTCLKAGVHVKKSELLRAGLIALSKLPTATLLKTVGGLVKIKTGRPGKQV